MIVTRVFLFVRTINYSLVLFFFLFYLLLPMVWVHCLLYKLREFYFSLQRCCNNLTRKYIINFEKMLVGYFVISIMYLMPVRGHFLRGVSSRCIFKYPHSAFKQYRNMGYTNGHTIAVYLPRIYPLKIFKLNLIDRKWQLIHICKYCQS